MLNVGFKNLGNIKNANIKLNKLTIFVGENNSGKTYLNYALYSLLDNNFTLKSTIYNDILKEAKEKGKKTVNIKDFLNNHFDKLKSNLENEFAKSLDRFFSAKEETFNNFKLELLVNMEEIQNFLINKSFSNELAIGKHKNVVCEISKEKNSEDIVIVVIDSSLPNDMYMDFINEIFFKNIFSKLVNDTFLLPAERTGLNIFYQELNSTRNALINSLQKNKTNPIEILRNMMLSSYPQPIADYIEFLNKISIYKKRKSTFSDLNNKLHNKIIKGKYHVDKDGVISFLPYKTYFKGGNYHKKIELHMASSTVKTFFSLEFYLEHIAKEGAFLIIDEPELNLHPDNQRNIARLISQIVNRGVNVILSTHSDYIVRELNNLIMLNEDFKNKNTLMEKYEYDKSELLSINNVSAYLIDGGTVEPMQINQNEGIIADTFDKVVNNLNSSSDDIYYTKMEDKEDVE